MVEEITSTKFKLEISKFWNLINVFKEPNAPILIAKAIEHRFPFGVKINDKKYDTKEPT